MKKTFFSIDPAKRERFLAVCTDEFAEFGYEAASTNRIVGKLGIAKGSFFKYAESKEDVYLYLAELVLQDLARLQASPETYRSPDLLARTQELLSSHMVYARRQPARYRLILRALLDVRSTVYPRVLELRACVSAAAGNRIYDGVDWSLYRFPENEIRAFLELLDLGLRQSAMHALSMSGDATALETHVTHALDLAARMLRSGIYRE